MLIFVIWCSCLILVVLLMKSSIVCKKDMLDNGLGNAKELNMRLGLEQVVGVHELIFGVFWQICFDCLALVRVQTPKQMILIPCPWG